MRPRVLLVAKDHPERDRLATLLTRLHCQVRLAGGATSALSQLHTQPATDLLLVELPADEMADLRRAQKQDSELEQIPFIAIGGEPDVDAEAYVPRPLDAFVLYDRMKRILAMGELPAEFWRGTAESENEEDLKAFLKQSLRTMVAGLPGLVESMRALNPGSIPVEDLLQAALRNGARVDSYVAYLDSFSGDVGVAHPLDVRETLEKVLESSEAYVSGRATVYRRLAEVPLVVAKEELLVQVFSSILINAAQAIQWGTAEENRIDVWTYAYANGWAMIEISDSGTGIPAGLLTKIFEPYFSTKKGLGMGLGLFVSRNIITSFGGTIGVESEMNRGTTFKIALPPAPSSNQ